jgi:hypothetical protein
MEKEEFFKYYIPALEKALSYIKEEDFQTISPDMFIEDSNLRNNLDSFENLNYDLYKELFYLVSIYFDAKNHNFQYADGKCLNILKHNILNEILEIKKKIPNWKDDNGYEL